MSMPFAARCALIAACVLALVWRHEVGDQCGGLGPVVKVELTRSSAAELQRLHLENLACLLDMGGVFCDEEALFQWNVGSETLQRFFEIFRSGFATPA